VILKDIISKEPLGPVVRQGDDAWFNVVRWSFFAMINADELGVTSANVDAMKRRSVNPDIRRLVGLDGDNGKGLGLPDDWSYQIIKQVGNYAESFRRNVGSGSPLKIKRGLNSLWKDGGLQYAPPMR
jgi:general L-amino acid transport system substrate-binding protein